MMGNEFFGLEKHPFFAEPTADAYCPFGGMEYARGQITRCVEHQEGIALITGLSGTGKTLLCRTLEKQFQGKFETVPLNGRNLNHPNVFYETLFSHLGMECASENLPVMRTSFARHLETARRFQAGLLLLIDDAQACALRVFEEIRQLLDLPLNPRCGVRVILFGNSSLEEKLGFRQLSAFSQRITTRYFLETFNRDETTAFLREELKQAGDQTGLFSKEVCRAIHKFTDGIPRVVNQLANHVLVTVLEEYRGKVTEQDGSFSSIDLKQDGEISDEIPDTGVFSNVDSDSAVDSERFADWENSFSSMTEEGKKEQDAAADDSSEQLKALPQIRPDQITPQLVERAWYSLQQFRTGNLNTSQELPSSGVFADIPDGAELKNTASSAIEFGSLDDDWETKANDTSSDSSDENSISFGELDLDDSEHVIDYEEESSDDSTMIWKYDEAQEVSDAIDEANAMPEEWDESARENAQHEDWTESENRAPIAGENDLRVPESAIHESSAKNHDDDLFDIFKGISNIHFPEKNDSAWISPSYSSGNPYVMSSETDSSSQTFSRVSSSNESFAKFAGTTQKTAWENSTAVSVSSQGGRVSEEKNSFSPFISSYQPRHISSPARRMSVDELIADAMMDDTIHSMKLLHQILNALREENLSNQRIMAPASYWFEMQDLVKSQMRRIAQERQGGNPVKSSDFPSQNQSAPFNSMPIHQQQAFHSAAVPGNTSVHLVPNVISADSSMTKYPNKDFYRPESLIEDSPFLGHTENEEQAAQKREALPIDRHLPSTPSRKQCVSSQSDFLSEFKGAGKSSSSLNQQNSYSSFSEADENITKTQEFQDIALLRSLLQNYPAKDEMDSETQDKLFQIISQLQTINQIS